MAKQEMIALTPSAAGALFSAGVMIGLSFQGEPIPLLLMAAILLAAVREDARTPFENGCWMRGRLFWTKTEPANNG